MRKTEREERWGGAAALIVLLLLGFTGCTRVLEHPATANEESDAARGTLASSGYLGDFPTQSPSAGDSSSSEPAIANVDGSLEANLRVHEIQLAHRDGREALIVVLSRPPAHVHGFGLRNPNRVVLDFDGAPTVASLQAHPVAGASVERVRIGSHEGKLRVVADLKGETPEVATEQEGRVIVTLLGPAASDASDQLVYRAPGLAEPRPDDPPTGLADAGDAARADTAPTGDVASATDPAAAPGDAPTAASASDPPADSVASAGAAPTADAAPAPPVALASATDTHPASADPTDDVERAAGRHTPAHDAEAIAALDDPPARRDDAQLESDLVLHERAPEEPTTYALAVQAKPQHAEPKPVQRTVSGGTITAVPVHEPREYTGQRISLDFKDADIQNVLRILADVSGLNIITTEEVQGKLTMRLVDVPWDQAFDAILRAKNLDSVREGNIIRVATVDQLKKEREAQRAANEAQKQVEPLEVKYLKINYAKADEKLVKKIQEVLSDRGTTTWDERTNTVVIRDIASGVASAEELVRHFDTQTPQILIESNIVEAQKKFLRDLGIQWGISNKAGPGTGNSTGKNFPGTITAGGVLAGGKNSPAGTVPFIADFPAASVVPGAGTAYDILLGSIDGSTALDARLSALETDNKIKIISRPRVVTLNNLPATIESLRILRVRLPSTGTVISTGAGGVAGSALSATEKINTGISLTVTPQVSSDGYIFLDVFAKSSTLGGSSSPDNIPDEVSRQAESHVLIRDGETFVLGGVYQDTLTRADAGIPYLRSIPVLGWAFRNHQDNDERQELLVFVTPKTINERGGTAEDLAKLPSAETLWQNRAH